MLRDQIIEKTTELFVHNGVKSMRMDDIASELGISKRTIYEQFSDRESLIEACARHFFEMKITNTLNPSLSQKDLEAKLDESFKKIRGGTNIQELIQSEGGSGLYKLCNIAQYNIETEYLITYGVGDNTVSFSYCFPADKLICKEIVDDNTIN